MFEMVLAMIKVIMGKAEESGGFFMMNKKQSLCIFMMMFWIEVLSAVPF